MTLSCGHRLDAEGPGLPVMVVCRLCGDLSEVVG